MEIIDGRKIARIKLEELKQKVTGLPFRPVFCDVLVGNDPASVQYVGMKAKTAEQVGFKFRQANFNDNIGVSDLVSEIKKISQEPQMCGLIVQLPLPQELNKQEVLDAIYPTIDVDCIGSTNSQKFYQGHADLIFPTAAAVMILLESLNLKLPTKNIVVVGQGDLVGRPVKYLLEQKGCNVTVVRSKTENATEILQAADIIISATGKPGLITSEKIKTGVVIIDAGTSESNGGIVGDVDVESVKDVAGYLSPVPGGVGPVTVACLMDNVYKVAIKVK